ncbi:MAG: nucleoside triphosphate pyrophosphatase [Vampirovibrionia bacterium]
MTNTQTKKLILASASPRRKELLKNLGYEFEIIPADIEETIDNSKIPEEIVKELSFQKAEHIAKKVSEPSVIIGSDTIVVINNKILGKPIDEKDAFNMLQELSGKVHQVISGIAIIDNKTNKTFIDCVSSDVYFRELSKEEIIKYIETKEPMDKAGAYAIQGIASIFIEKIEGCYNNIVGLPVFTVAKALKDFGMDVLN